MLSFLLGGNKTIGLDIGTSSIKVAELEKTRKGYMLKRFGFVSVNPGWIKDGEIVDPGSVSQAITSLITSVGTKRKNVVASVFGNSVNIKRIGMAPIEENLIAEAVKWEAEQYIPFDINEAAIDYHLLKVKPIAAGENLDVLLIGAKQEFVFRVLDAVEAAKLKCPIVDVSAFALANCFEANYGRLDGLTALLNIGAGVTSLVIVENGEVVFARDSIVGGNNYTNEIHKSMGVSIQEAESLKLSASLGQEVPAEVNSVIAATTEQTVDEIRNSFEFFAATGGAGQINRIFVSGGSIFVPSLVEEVAKSVNLPFEVLNPFQLIEYDPKTLTAEYIQQIQSISPVAIGLAMREVDDA